MKTVLWIFCQEKEKNKEKDKGFIIKDRKKRKKYIVKDKKEKSKMQNELFIAFMVGWAAAIGFSMIGGVIWWLCIEWEKIKVKKLELEKIVCITKCKLRELENENHKEIEKLEEINKKL